MATRRRVRKSPPSLTHSNDSFDLLGALWELHHGMEAMSRRMEASLGITGPQRFALRAITLEPGKSAQSLAERLRVHASTVTGVVDRLERKGLAMRVRSEHDRRSLELWPTEAGKALLERPDVTIEAVVQRCMEKMEPADLKAGRALLDRLSQQLHLSADEPAPLVAAPPAPVPPVAAPPVDGGPSEAKKAEG